ncbi:hypothetical protein AVEN_190684-1 [Araneus ventricosus]|uniref:Uncharacterized protein n=1 Tax=Araneus ventricosus TaxID=182803 RepID=A0A4Y2Q742_ARAVE|nr:hypothetical protein AVEN_190684-1 [Araneus ventricosus]
MKAFAAINPQNLQINQKKLLTPRKYLQQFYEEAKKTISSRFKGILMLLAFASMGAEIRHLLEHALRCSIYMVRFINMVSLSVQIDATDHQLCTYLTPVKQGIDV